MKGKQIKTGADAVREAYRAIRDVPHNAANEPPTLGSAHFGQLAGMATAAYHNPQKMFTRAEVLAILRALNATDARFHEAITAFERME
jgi:hypothetical protein